jgi:hypothetical protein
MFISQHKKLFKLVTNYLTLEDYYKAFVSKNHLIIVLEQSIIISCRPQKIINSCLILFPWYWKLWRKRSDYWNSKHDFTKGLQDLRKAYEVKTCLRAKNDSNIIFIGLPSRVISPFNSERHLRDSCRSKFSLVRNSKSN